MGSQHHPELRGFDSYESKLGDHLRGERASLGKSLLDVQRDLKIRADYIAAIEDANAAAFPFAGFAAGYVRAYARYLGLDGDDIYRRFCVESGFVGVEPTNAMKPGRRAVASESAARATTRSAAGGAVITTRFMKSNEAAARLDLGSSIRGLASVAVLAVVVGGLGYGGWTLLKDLQRLGFAPIPTAPDVMVSAPDILAPADAPSAPSIPAPNDEPRITLAAIYAAQEAAPAIAPRDGPISSIDPRQAGIYAHPTPAAPVLAGAADGDALVAPVDPGLALAAKEVEIAAVAALRGVDILAVEDAWVRVRDGERKVLFTGILAPGERFTLPEGAVAPQLRAGNAGAVYVVVDGAAFGPLGSGPEVAKNVDLKPDAIRAAYPPAAHVQAPAPLIEKAASSSVAENALALRED